MKLGDLPVEILFAISVHLHGFDIASLWFSGSSPLRYKLANGGISQLDWNFNTKLRPFKWPSLFSSLSQLTAFRIQTESNSHSVLFTSAQLRTLPRRLRELSIFCLGAFSALNDLLTLNPDFFPVLKRLEIAIRMKDPPLGPNETMKWPKSLESLKLLVRANHTVALDLSTLPPYLTELIGTFAEVSVPTSTTGFPKSLTKLELILGHFFDILPLLPPGLEHLSFDIEPENPKLDDPHYKTWKEHGIRNLPPALQSVSLPIINFTREVLQQFPPTLTEIKHRHTANITTNCLQFLPPHITDCSYMLPKIITKDIAQRLPRSITSFKGSVTMEAIPFLNAKLFGCTIAGPIHDRSSFESLGIDRLPLYELKSLTLTSTTRVPFSALPSSLTSLRVLTGVMTASEFRNLPKSLVSLIIGEPKESGPIEDWKYLPENLKELVFYNASCLPAESSLLLPCRLTTLNFVHCHSLSQDWFGGLPTTLRDVSIIIETFVEPFTGNIAWPKDLTHLEMTVEDYELNTQMMSSMIKTLPKLMITIYIDWHLLHPQFIISNEDTASLSKRLEFLYLPSLKQQDNMH